MDARHRITSMRARRAGLIPTLGLLLAAILAACSSNPAATQVAPATPVTTPTAAPATGEPATAP